MFSSSFKWFYYILRMQFYAKFNVYIHIIVQVIINKIIIYNNSKFKKIIALILCIHFIFIILTAK